MLYVFFAMVCVPYLSESVDTISDKESRPKGPVSWVSRSLVVFRIENSVNKSIPLNALPAFSATKIITGIQTLIVCNDENTPIVPDLLAKRFVTVAFIVMDGKEKV
jgi:hypothetical protein